MPEVHFDPILLEVFAFSKKWLLQLCFPHKMYYKYFLLQMIFTNKKHSFFVKKKIPCLESTSASIFTMYFHNVRVLYMQSWAGVSNFLTGQIFFIPDVHASIVNAQFHSASECINISTLHLHLL